mgnify:CR=1 FL=1
MKIVIISGSARKGNTLAAINAFIKGASEKNKIEKIKTVAKFKLWKSGIVRKIGQIIYM